MKKTAALLVTLSLTASLTACIPGVNPDRGSEPIESTVPTEESMHPSESVEIPETTVPEEIPETTVETVIPSISKQIAMIFEPVQEVLYSEEDPTLRIFESSYPAAQVRMPGNPEAEAKINGYFQEERAHIQENCAALRETAIKNQENVPMTGAFFTQYSMALHRADNGAISVTNEGVVNSGGAHPSHILNAVNFSTSTGDVLGLSDVLSDGALTDVLYSKVVEKLQGDAEYFFDNWEEVAKVHFDMSTSESQNWYFTEDSMVFFFDPYDIAPGASGVVQAAIPYTELQGVILDKYQPQTKKSDNSSKYVLGAAKESEIDAGNFENHFRVTIDPEGEKVVLYSGTPMTQVRLESGQWISKDDGSEYFVVESVLFAANEFSENDLLIVSTYIPDALPNLRLTVGSSEENSESYYIFQSGKDGSILLLDGDTM